MGELHELDRRAKNLIRRCSRAYLELERKREDVVTENVYDTGLG